MSNHDKWKECHDSLTVVRLSNRDTNLLAFELNRINILFHILNAHQYTCTVIVIIMVGVTFWLSILTTTR